MKKLLILLILSSSLGACNNQKPIESKSTVSTVEADDDSDGGTARKLILNNGAKWKVDSSTNSNVNDLQQILKRFDNGNDRSLLAYTKVQYDLQQGINKMIAECKMKGLDHEALHKWLKPLIGQVADLKKAVAHQDAAETYKVIKSQLGLYSQYFEL